MSSFVCIITKVKLTSFTTMHLIIQNKQIRQVSKRHLGTTGALWPVRELKKNSLSLGTWNGIWYLDLGTVSGLGVLCPKLIKGMAQYPKWSYLGTTVPGNQRITLHTSTWVISVKCTSYRSVMATLCNPWVLVLLWWWEPWHCLFELKCMSISVFCKLVVLIMFW